MFEYEPRREFFKMSLKPNKSDDKMENVTEEMEKRKHELMKEKLRELEEKCEYDKEEHIIEDKTSAYEYDCKKIENMTKTLKMDNYTTMLACEKILDSLGIENYRLWLMNKENIETIDDEEDEDLDYEEQNWENEDEKKVEHMNLYKYKGEFYALSLSSDIKKKNFDFEENDVIFKDALEIPIDTILNIYEIYVQEKPKNDEKTYVEMNSMEIYEFLYKNLRQQIKYKQQMEEKSK